MHFYYKKKIDGGISYYKMRFCNLLFYEKRGGSSNAQVGIVEQHLDAGSIFERRVDFLLKPPGEFFVALGRRCVGAEEVDTEIFEMLAGEGDVAQDAFLGFAFGAAEQADALEILRHHFGRDVFGDAFLPDAALLRVETLYATAELDLGGGESLGKGGELAVVHIVRFEPEGMDVLFPHDAGDELQCVVL